MCQGTLNLLAHVLPAVPSGRPTRYEGRPQPSLNPGVARERGSFRQRIR